jgi:hypothetical protein
MHQDRLVSNLTSTAVEFQQQIHHLTQIFTAQGLGPVEAAKRATATIMRQIQSQAAMLSYLDIFVVLLLGSIMAAALAAFLKKIDLSKAHPGA